MRKLLSISLVVFSLLNQGIAFGRSDPAYDDQIGKSYTRDGYRYAPQTNNEKVIGFSLFKNDQLILKQSLDKSDPDFSFQSKFLVFPLAKATLKSKLDIDNPCVKLFQGNLDSVDSPILKIDGISSPCVIVGTGLGDINGTVKYELIKLEPKPKKLFNLNIDYPIEFGTFDQSKQLQIACSDHTFKGWNASSADSPFPPVLLKVNSNGLMLSDKDLRTISISKEQLEQIAAKLKTEIEKNNTEDKTKFNLDPRIWSTMLNLVYTGHASDAWQFLSQAWPTYPDDEKKKPKARLMAGLSTDENWTKEQFKQMFKNQLKKSNYWKDLQKINNGQVL